MDKQQIIGFIEEQMRAGKITKDDLSSLVQGVPVHSVMSSSVDSSVGSSGDERHSEDSSKKLINTFYGIGAIIMLGGIGILIGQNWDEIGFVGRIMVSLGISLLAYISGFLTTKNPQRVLSQVAFTISAALAPLGVYVLLHEAHISFEWPYTIYTSITLFILFGYALWATKKSILILLSVGFATWAYYEVVAQILSSLAYSNTDLFKLAVMLLGFAYILIAYGNQKSVVTSDMALEKEKKSVRNVLYGLGTLSVLGAGISIGGMFNIFFILVIFGAFYGSVYLKSRAMLILAALFLMAHMIKLTSEYFADSVGWPVALIFVGLLIMGIGYGTFELNKKYMSVE